MTNKKRLPSEAIIVGRRLEVVIEQDEDGFCCFVPALEGCHTQARSLNEMRTRLSEAVGLYLDVMSDRLRLDIEYRKE